MIHDIEKPPQQPPQEVISSLPHRSTQNLQSRIFDEQEAKLIFDTIQGYKLNQVFALPFITELQSAHSDLNTPEFSEDDQVLEEVFGAELVTKYPEECREIIQRALWAAQILKDLTNDTSLAIPGAKTLEQDAWIGLQWLCQILPQAVDDTGKSFSYKAFDTLKITLETQLAGVLSRLIAHSFAAGMTAYELANRTNTLLSQELGSDDYIDAYKMMFMGFIHEAGRLFTHQRGAHDKLLEFMLEKAGLGHLIPQVEGMEHPRLLNTQAATVTPEQYITWLEFFADFFTKSINEAAPWKDGEPQFRTVAEGPLNIYYSVKNYQPNGNKPGNIPELQQYIAENTGDMAIYYLLELMMVAQVPVWLEENGISVQEALQVVEPLWRELLTALIMEQKLPGWLEAKGVKLPGGPEIFASSKAVLAGIASAR